MNKLISANYWFGCDWVFYEVGYLGWRAGQLSLACAVVYLWNTGYLRVTRRRLYPGIQQCLERKITLPSTSIIRWNITMESTPKKLIYSTSRNSNDLPSWYPFFHLPYTIDVKVTCTGFYVYMEIMYIDSSPDPEIYSPYVYSKPSVETIRRLYGIPSIENYISDH